MSPPPHLYAIGLGSNRRHGRFGAPRGILVAATRALAAHGRLDALSPIHASRPLGPSSRSFANAAALIESPLAPLDLLAALKAIEKRFGRRAGQRWGARVLDLDILLWSGGSWRDSRLVIPHPALAERAFVLRPLLAIAPGWRLPGATLAIRHLSARLTGAKPVHRGRTRSGP